MEKRGISNIVATTLIVLVTVAGTVILWIGLEPMMMIEVVNTEGKLRVVTSEGHTYYHEDANAASIQVIAEGKQSADYVQIILLLEDGSEVSSVHFAPELNSRRVYAKSLSNYPRPTHAAVAPAFKNDGRTIVGQRSEFKKIPIVPKFEIYTRTILPANINVVGDPDLDQLADDTPTTSSFIFFDSPPTPLHNEQTNLNTVDIDISTNGLTGEVVFLDWQNSLVGWWGMDVRSSNEVVDSSGLGRNGAISGASFTDVNGVFGDAIECDYADGFINIGPSKSFFPDENSWTITAWFKADTISTENTKNRIITLHRASGTPWGTGLALVVGTDKLDADGDGNVAETVAIVRYDRQTTEDHEHIAGNIVIDQWYFFGATYDGTTLTSYLNDVSILDATFSNDFIDMKADTDAFICSYKNTNSDRFEGLIDEVMIFDRALSASEMASLYDASSSGTPYFASFNVVNGWPYNYIGYAIDSNGDHYSTERRVLFKG